MDINNLWSDYDLNSKKQNSRCLSVNTILEGKYLVGPVLGQGGFGITYVGYDLNMESKIAIKEYFPVELVSRDTTTMHGDRVLSLSGEKSVTYKAGLKKYVAEAQNVSQFSEVPGVVSVKDFFYANETAYIVMEFIDGISLKDYLKEKGGRLTEEETLKITKPILEALVQVHKSGIIHRDISPDNIMLTFADGNSHNKIESVKLIDFGAARMTEKNDQKSLTIILKHGYAPEEQYRTHGEQGPWTDVYALCAVLYRMLTGETPTPAMDRMFQDELKTFEQCNTNVSANTAGAILKGLAVKKDDRIQSVQELIAALYEGKKVAAEKKKSGYGGGRKNASAMSGARGNRKKYGLIGACAAVAAVVVIAAMSGTKTNDEQSETVILAESQSGIGEASEQESVGTTIENTGKESVNTENEIVIVDMEEEEDIGEQIAFYSPMNSIGNYGRIFCLPDGTVKARGSNEYGQCNVEYWDHVVAVESDGRSTMGLRSNGTVLYTGADGTGIDGVESWYDIVSIELGVGSAYGITVDGSVVVAGESGGALDLENIASWTDMRDIAVALRRDDIVVGLKRDGTLVSEGAVAKLSTPDDWQNVEQILVEGNVLVGIEKDGTVKAVPLDLDEYINQEYIDYYNSLPSLTYLDAWSGLGVTTEGKLMAAVPYANTSEEIIEFVGKEVDLQSQVASACRDSSGCFYVIKENCEFAEIYLNSGGNCQRDELVGLQQAILIMDEGNGGPGIVAQRTDGKLLYYGYMDSIGKLCSGARITEKIDHYAATANLREQIFVMEDGSVYSRANWFPKDGVKEILYHGNKSCVVVLMEDGSVQLYPGDEYSEASELPHELVEGWSGIQDIWRAGGRLYGLCQDGTIVSEDQDVNMSHDFKVPEGMRVYIDGYTILGVGQSGNVEIIRMSSDNEMGQYQIDGWDHVADIAFGESHTVALREDGTVLAAGSNHCGQCDVEEWKDIISIDAVAQCTIGVTKDGQLLMAGSLCE